MLNICMLPAPRERLLYFHALASNFECTVPLRVLGNASMWEANRESARGEFVVSVLCKWWKIC